MFEKLKGIESRFEQIEESFTIPEITGDAERFRELMREHKRLLPIVEEFRRYQKWKRSIEENTELLDSSDHELRALAEEELKEAKIGISESEKALQILLLPKDPADEKNVIVEIRGGAGGEESALFASDLYRMYSMFAASCGWKTELLSVNETELGGFKEISFSVIGESAYSKMKFESGVHRVQRVPQTESQGRIHTSTVTVAVLPEMEEVDVVINPADLEIETCKSSGAGGQHINKTESAVRLTHIPTGIVIECDQERSQLQNKEKALRLLYTKLYDMKQREQTEAIASTRKSQVGSGDRSEKIRTYNYPQSRVTDHRINKTLFNLAGFLNGDMADLVGDLMAAEAAERLKGEE